MFFKDKKKVNAIKLYSIGSDQADISRPGLVDFIFVLFDEQFGRRPKDYVIHGPYGVRKGGSIGIKAFKSKLDAKGHEKYYALSGDTENELGFDISFNANLGYTTYSELILWWHEGRYDPSFEKIAKALSAYFKLSCGFQMQIDDSYDVSSESKIKKGIFSTSISTNYEHLTWIKNYQSGKFRGLFSKNILSRAQLKQAEKLYSGIEFKKFDDKYCVYNIV